jgi:hypothetical protein
MAEWLRLQLGGGTYQGQTFFSSAASREMWAPQVIVSGVPEQVRSQNLIDHFLLYGLGWIVSDFHGRKIVWHGGGIDGMVSQVVMVPEERLGGRRSYQQQF